MLIAVSLSAAHAPTLIRAHRVAQLREQLATRGEMHGLALLDEGKGDCRRGLRLSRSVWALEVEAQNPPL